MLVKLQIKIVTIIPRIAQYRNKLPTPNISAKGPEIIVPIGEIDIDIVATEDAHLAGVYQRIG